MLLDLTWSCDLNPLSRSTVSSSAPRPALEVGLAQASQSPAIRPGGDSGDKKPPTRDSERRRAPAVLPAWKNPPHRSMCVKESQQDWRFFAMVGTAEGRKSRNLGRPQEPARSPGRTPRLRQDPATHEFLAESTDSANGHSWEKPPAHNLTLYSSVPGDPLWLCHVQVVAPGNWPNKVKT